MEAIKIYSYKNIWKISTPIIISLIAQNIINVTNTAFLGHLGEIELGASAIGGLLYVCIYMLGFGFSIGTQILISIRNGEKKYKEIGITLYHSFYFLTLVAIIITALTYLIAPKALQLTIHSKEVYTAIIIYLFYRIPGLIIAFANCLIRAFYIGITETKILSYAAFITALVNIILDYLLIFGYYGFPKLGIKGAAISSVIAELAALIFMVIYTLYKKYHISYHIFSYSKILPSLFKKLLNISTPVMIQNFISLFGWFIFFIIIEKMGEQPLAISNIIRSIYLVLMIPVWAFVSTNSTLVGNAVGQNKYELILPITFKITKLSFYCTSIISITCFFFPTDIIQIYTSNIQLIKESIQLLQLITGALILFSISMILFSTISGVGKTKQALIIEISIIAIYLIYTYLISKAFPNNLLLTWSAEYIYFFLIGIISYLYVKKYCIPHSQSS